MYRIHLIIVGIIVLSSRSGATLDWTLEAVDTSRDNFSWVLDTSSCPHIIYKNYDRTLLKYAFKKDDKWNIEILDSAGIFSSLKIDKNGALSFCYAGNKTLEYFKKDSIWHKDTIDNCYASNNILYFDLDSQGKPNVLYYCNNNNNIKYARFDGTAWKICLIDTFFYGIDFAIDRNDSFHIVYSSNYEDSNHIASYKITYGKWNVADFNKYPVDSGTSGGTLGLDSSQTPYILYGKQDMLKYAKLIGNNWDVRQIDSGSVYYGVSIIFDTLNNPNIAYMDTISYGTLMYGRWDGGKWDKEVITEGSIDQFSSYSIQWVNKLFSDNSGHFYISWSYKGNINSIPILGMECAIKDTSRWKGLTGGDGFSMALEQTSVTIHIIETYVNYSHRLYYKQIKPSGQILREDLIDSVNQYSGSLLLDEANSPHFMASRYSSPPIIYYGHFKTAVEEAASNNNQLMKFRISPNPSLNSTSFIYFLSTKSKVSLKLYDLSGRCVKTLVNEEKPAGSHSITFDAKDLATGVYFVTIAIGNYKETKKLVKLVK